MLRILRNRDHTCRPRQLQRSLLHAVVQHHLDGENNNNLIHLNNLIKLNINFEGRMLPRLPALQSDQRQWIQGESQVSVSFIHPAIFFRCRYGA